MSYQFAQVNNAKLHYDIQGEGEPLVLIHAGIVHMDMWDEQMAAFAQNYRVIRYDVRGWGQSKCPPGTYSDYGDLRELLQQLGIEQAHILGISNGGRIAIDFTLAYPQMVKSLILVAPDLGGYSDDEDEDTAQKEEAIAAAYKSGDKAHAAELTAQLWVDGVGRTPQQVDPQVRQQALEMILHTYELPDDEGKKERLAPPATGRLAEIRVPTLIIIGDRDLPVMASIVGFLEAEIAGAQKVVMTSVAHFPNMENPQRFNQIVLDFLGSL